VRVSEWVALLYFAYLLIVALIKRPWPRRRQAGVVSALPALLVGGVALSPVTPFTSVARDWLPVAYLLGGYWLSGLFFVAPMRHVEARCEALDRRLLFDSGFIAWIGSAPRAVLEVLEFFYLTCFLFVPGCVALVVLTHPLLADQSWAVVLLSEFGAFGVLPWIQTRPPRSLEPPGPFDRRPVVMRRLSGILVQHASIHVNTLPSGHVAGSLAAAIALSAALPRAGLAAMAIVCIITVSAVAGRYHYAIDAVTGVGVALIAWAVVAAVV
jgi:hypothetical protein